MPVRAESHRPQAARGRARSLAQHDGSGRHPAGASATYGHLKSCPGVPCRTDFVNRTAVSLRVLWLDFQGAKPVAIGVSKRARAAARLQLQAYCACRSWQDTYKRLSMAWSIEGLVHCGVLFPTSRS